MKTQGVLDALELGELVQEAVTQNHEVMKETK